jgi:hypothetical protein
MEPSEPRAEPSQKSPLMEAIYNYVANGDPLTPEQIDELKRGDSAGLVASLVTEKLIDVRDKNVISRCAELLNTAGRFTLSDPSNRSNGLR